MKRLFTILSLFLCAVIHVMAQMSVSAPRHVAVGEQFRLQYSIATTDVKGFRAGNIPDAFEVLMGPSTSTQQSFQIINGKSTSSSSVTYTYILLATKNGTFTIPGARARVMSKDVTSHPVKITVSGKAQQSSGGQSYQQNRPQGVRPSGSHISGNDLFIKVSANKKRVHEQEPILLTYKVYAQVELTQLEGKMPDLNGFHTQEVPLPQQKSFHIEHVNGRPYRCVTWSQYVMFPQMTGKMEIPSITFKGIVVQENTNVDPFEAFFNGGSGYVEVKKNIIAPGMTIQVDPLPQKPEGFSGGVGQFSISASVDKNTVKAGNPVKVRVVIGGNGNLKLINQPELSLPKDFDKYDPKVTDKTKLTSEGLTGNMLYDFLIVPRNQGKYEIPPIEFTYFDTRTSTYKTIKTNAIPLTVEKGNGKSAEVADFSQSEDQDIHNIFRSLDNEKNNDIFVFGDTSYIVFNAVVVIIFIVLLVIFRKKAMEMADITSMKGKRANKVAGKRLKKAAKLMEANKSSEFFDEVLRALWGYVSDKLSIPSSELSRENIAEKLEQKQTDQKDIDSFLEALDECEFERYAPGDASGNMRKTYDKAVSAITNIEEGMKQRKKHHNNNKENVGKTVIVLLAILFSLFNVAESKAADKVTDSSSSSYKVNKAKADEAYLKGDYQKAIGIYEELLKNDRNAELYYNLGNSYYRTDNITKAVLAFERARLLNPGNKDIKHNLEIASSKTIDNIQPEEKMFFVAWYHDFVNILTSDTWACTALVSLVVSLILLLVYLFAGPMFVRRIAFYVSTVLIILFFLGNLFAWQLKSFALESNGAIVTVATLSVKSSPTSQSAETFAIHEGTRVEIIDSSLKGWLQIHLADGREGWIADNTVEKFIKQTK